MFGDKVLKMLDDLLHNLLMNNLITFYKITKDYKNDEIRIKIK